MIWSPQLYDEDAQKCPEEAESGLAALHNEFGNWWAQTNGEFTRFPIQPFPNLDTFVDFHLGHRMVSKLEPMSAVDL